MNNNEIKKLYELRIALDAFINYLQTENNDILCIMTHASSCRERVSNLLMEDHAKKATGK